MTTKNYQKRVARMVQEAKPMKYQRALNLVRSDETDHPEATPMEVRALRIVEADDVLHPVWDKK